MKIFYKKDYLKVKKELDEVLDTISIQYEKIVNLTNENKLYKESHNKLKQLTHELDEEIQKLKVEIKSLNCSKGGLTKQINKLKNNTNDLQNEKKDLENKLAESMTDKYVLKKIPSGRTPNTQKIKAPIHMKPQVARFMRESHE